ncbi:hypothetical protein PTKIN_Ptkin09bG0247100 [Pterospermum kingtungense]
MKQKQKYFKRNGGLLLQEQLFSNEGNVDKIRFFASKELEKIDGSIVAIKKSKMMDEKNVNEKKLQQFINEKNSLFDILDPMVRKDGPQVEVMAVAMLAKRCLNLNGKKRPTMKQVAVKLEWIRFSEEATIIEQWVNEDSDTDDEIDPSAIASGSTSRSIINDSITLSVDT